MAGVVGKAGDGSAQAVVARPSEGDAAAFAGGVGDGRDAGLGGELVLGLEALADDRRSSARIWAAQMRPARGKDMTMLAIREVGDGMLDAAGQLGDRG